VSVHAGLVTAVLLLTVHAWAARRSAQLRGRRLLSASSMAAGRDLAVIGLADVVLTHLH
jgi:hypothetical protein